MMKKITWHNEKRKVKDLKPYKSNPRQITKEQMSQLKRSIEKFDYAEIVAIQPDNTIIAGHMRIKALISLGRKNEEIDVRVPNRQLTEEEMREYLIRSNKNTGDWDYDALANEWNLADLCDWGFTAEELQFDVTEVDPIEPDNDILEPPKNPKTKLGDIYELANGFGSSHRLVCGDCTHPDTVRNCLGDQTPILLVTDPPYGVNYDPVLQYKGKNKASGKVQNDDKANWEVAWCLFPGSVAYVWHSSKFAFEVFKSLVNAGFVINQEIIWKKQSFTLGGSDYQWQHEPCCYAIRKGHNHNWQGSRDQSTVWEISNLNAFGANKDDERTAHSTQKPLQAMSRPISNNTAKGEAVYDPFLGSGTTLIAAEMLERICYGIEIDPAYCDIIVDRWAKHRQKMQKDVNIKLNGKKIKW